MMLLKTLGVEDKVTGNMGVERRIVKDIGIELIFFALMIQKNNNISFLAINNFDNPPT